MKKRIQILRLFSIMLSVSSAMLFVEGCATTRGNSVGCSILDFEVKVPLGVDFPATTEAFVGPSDSEYKAHAQLMQQHVEERFVVYEYWADLIEDPNRFIVIHPAPAPAQVFKGNLPAVPAEAQWYDWHQPEFLDSSNMLWANLPYLVTPETRSMVIPTNCFQVRCTVLHLYQVGH